MKGIRQFAAVDAKAAGEEKCNFDTKKILPRATYEGIKYNIVAKQK